MTKLAFFRGPAPLGWDSAPGLLARLRASRSGIALTEFAISLPIFVTLLFGGLEIISLVMAHMRMSQVAISVATISAISPADREFLPSSRVDSAPVTLAQMSAVMNRRPIPPTSFARASRRNISGPPCRHTPMQDRMKARTPTSNAIRSALAHGTKASAGHKAIAITTRNSRYRLWCSLMGRF